MHSSDLLADLIRYHRRARGLSQIALAQTAQVSRTVVQRLERGNLMASWQNVMRILTVLKVDIEFQSPLMAEFERVGVGALELHFHALIRERAEEFQAPEPVEWPALSSGVNAGGKRWFSLPGVTGGFQYWFADRAQEPNRKPRLIVESWNRDVLGSEARHEITAEGAKFMGPLINGVHFSAKSSGGIAARAVG